MLKAVLTNTFKTWGYSPAMAMTQMANMPPPRQVSDDDAARLAAVVLQRNNVSGAPQLLMCLSACVEV